jgi:hypothetical protein
MGYTLTARQKLAYTDRFDIYRRVDPIPENARGFKKDISYNVAPVASMVRCLWMNHPDINSYKVPLGRTLTESADVLDVVHFPMGVDIQDQDCLRLRSTGHPQTGEWFIVMGFGAARQSRGNRQGNYIEVRIKRMLAAPGLEGVS